jgi:hypothetical protein
MKSKIHFKRTIAPLMIMATGILLWASCGGGSSSSSTTTTTTTPAASNQVALSANPGPNGSSGLINTAFVTVTVCQPSTTNCAQIPNVLVDTGSIGLRIVASALGSTTLTQVSDSSQDALQECIQYGDTSYSWGPMQLADVELGGETAKSIPVQVLGGNTFSVPSSLCLTSAVNPALPNNGNEDTVATLGANGILGIGDAPWDCGSTCAPANIATGSTYAGYPYYICPTGQACEEVGVPTSDQATNPVAAFSSSDNNGVMITFPSVGASGAASVAGTLTFGIGTQTDNAFTGATLYAADDCGFVPTVTYNNATYTDTYCTSSTGTGGMGGIFDTGSAGYYVLDGTTLASLGIADCPANSAGAGWYCVSGGGTATLSGIGLTGYGNVGSGTVSISIADATTLFTNNSSNWEFSNIGSDSGTGPANDFFDFGLPFFFNRTVFVGIAGQTVPNGATAPNGFVGF